MFSTRYFSFFLAAMLILVTMGVLKRHSVSNLREKYTAVAAGLADYVDPIIATDRKAQTPASGGGAESEDDFEKEKEFPSTTTSALPAYTTIPASGSSGLDWTVRTIPVNISSLPPFDPVVDGENLHLTHEECAYFFPGAYDELAVAVSRGRIPKPAFTNASNSDLVPHIDKSGHITARLHGGHLYILSRGKDVWHRQLSILHQIHRALLTSPMHPRQIPNITFTISVNDHPSPNVWSLARPLDNKGVEPSAGSGSWLMPDFGFWGWPEPHISTHSEAREKITALDSTLSWADKLSKAVWRGTVKWNRALRQKLLDVAEGKSWSDVAKLQWGENSLGMEDFCKYKFLLYTEGVTYSGRLRYFQHCRSVIVSPKLEWRQFYGGLLRTSGEEQNIVEVDEDWGNLADVVETLVDDAEKAERIANNTVSVFRDRYLTQASEVCYWRRLFEAWSEVQPMGESEKEADLSTGERGTAWEDFVVMDGEFEWKLEA